MTEESKPPQRTDDEDVRAFLIRCAALPPDRRAEFLALAEKLSAAPCASGESQL